MVNADRLPAQRLAYEEKRANKRFCLEREVDYRVLVGQHVRDAGGGKTINMSSSGVCFTSENTLAIGVSVELSIIWTAQLSPSCPMKLMVHGSVIRSSAGRAVLAIERYEFRTQKSHSLHRPLPDALEAWRLSY
jgi:hypothetical protein